MLFNENNDNSISPIKSITNKQNKPSRYVSNPKISRIKESYYLKTGSSKIHETFCNESRNETFTSTNTTKFMSMREKSSDKFEGKIQKIIERRVNLQNMNLKRSRINSKQITPEKKEVNLENTLNLTPISNGESLGVKENKFGEKLNKRLIFTPNSLRELNENKELNEIMTENQKNVEYANLFREEKEENKNILHTFRENQNKILTEKVSNSLVVKENNEEDRFKAEILGHLESIVSYPETEFLGEGDFNYSYNLLNSLKKKKKELITSQDFIQNCIKEVYLDGSIYYGSKMHNLKNGKGIFIDKSQQIYIGEFKNGKKDGFGILKSKNGNIIYEGHWKSNKYNGNGRLINSKYRNSNRLFNYRNMDTIQENWNMYEGEFLSGVYNGIGVLSIDKTKIYKGEFKQGYIHGHGIIFDRWNPENKLEGDWRLNIYVSNLL